MLRLIIFMLQVAALVAAAVWIAERPGEVRLRWLGYEINADVGILLLVVFLLMVLSALIYHFWRKLVEAPGRTRRAFEQRRRGRGYRALTQGMVAVAAGDPDEARKWARKADVLLNEPPLTLLLSAQAAQLGGDETAAERYFQAMLDRPETRFLGLRGLVQQALKRGDEAAALVHVQEAYRLRPKTPWVLETLFDLAERQGRLPDAARAVDEARRRRALPAAEADRRRAVLAYEEALAEQEAGQPLAALDRIRLALRLAPDLTPAAALGARLALGLGRRREAQKILTRAWAVAPHPQLAAAWRELHPPSGSAEDLRQLRRLVAGRAEHLESHLALAEAALAAKLRGEARRALEAAEAQGGDARSAELMARLLLAEGDEREVVQGWLEKMADRLGTPLWRCEACGHQTGEWTPRCSVCGAFDSYQRQPGPPPEPSRLLPTTSKADALPAAEPSQPPPPAETPKPSKPPADETPPEGDKPANPEEAVRRGL